MKKAVSLNRMGLSHLAGNRYSGAYLHKMIHKSQDAVAPHGALKAA